MRTIPQQIENWDRLESWNEYVSQEETDNAGDLEDQLATKDEKVIHLAINRDIRFRDLPEHMSRTWAE